MLNSLHDFSNTKHHVASIVSKAIIASDAKEVTMKATERIAIDTSLALVTLLFAVMAVTFYRPQIYCAREFYKKCFNNCWYHGPPRKWIYDLVWMVMDAFLTSSIVQYLYSFATQASVLASDYYISIAAVYIAFLAFRYFWINAFWNYHNKKAFVEGDIVYSWEVSSALIAACAFAFLAWAALLVLLGLFGASGDWTAFGLIILPIIWVTLVTIWTVAVYTCLPAAPFGKKGKSCAI